MLTYVVFECELCGHQYQVEWDWILNLYPDGLGLGGSDYYYGVIVCPNCKVTRRGRIIQDVMGHRLQDGKNSGENSIGGQDGKKK